MTSAASSNSVVEFALRPVVEPGSASASRATSSARSRRLCAFSVLSSQDPVRDFRLGNDERDDRLRAERAHRAEPVIAVGRPVLAVARGHSDDRVEEAVELVDRVRQTPDVCFREIALERRRLDAVDRQRGEQSASVRRAGRDRSRAPSRRRRRSRATAPRPRPAAPRSQGGAHPTRVMRRARTPSSSSFSRGCHIRGAEGCPGPTNDIDSRRSLPRWRRSARADDGAAVPSASSFE